MQDKYSIKEKRALKRRISKLEALVAKHEKAEESLRHALRKEYDDREKWIEEQTTGLIAANIQLRQENAERKKADDALHYRVEFERLITTLSTNFIKLSPDEIDSGINKALQTIGEFVDVDRSYVFLFSEKVTKIGDIYEWCAKDIKPQIQNLKGRSIDDEFPWFAKKIKKHGVFHVSSSDELPIEANAEKGYLKSHEIQSLIAVPMFCGRSFIGFVGFDSVRMKKTWAVDIIALLRIVGEIFANALERKWLDMAIRENENKYKLLFECASDGIVVLDMDGNILDCNNAYMNLVGMARKDIVGKPVATFFVEEYKKVMQQRFPMIRKAGKVELELEIIHKDGKIIPIYCKATAIFDGYGNIKGAITHFRDLTERKQNEEMLCEAHHQMERKGTEKAEKKLIEERVRERIQMEKALLNTINDSALMVDIEGTILALYDKTAKGFGKTIDELTGLCFYDFIPPNLANKVKAKMNEVIHFAKQVDFKEWVGAKQISINFSPILDEHGKVVRVAILSREIEKSSRKEDGLDLLLKYREDIVNQDQNDFIYLQKTREKRGLQDFAMFKQVPKKIGITSCLKNIISRSPKIGQLFDILPSVAESVSTVLIQGESGTGKHLFAQAIHNLSPRREKPFIVVNCGALPDTLLESELFGYKAGAFTDAKKDKPGRFALADGGTLFLDEIGDISPAMQIRLLRFLQERVYEPLGSVKSVRANVRIIAATNKNLMGLVKEGKFRQDLYYRINVVRLDLPALRERLEDVPILTEQFIAQLNAQQGKKVKGISEEALICLLSYDYPGNIRELENIIERAFVLCNSGNLERKHLPETLCASLNIDYSKESDHTAFMKMEAAFLLNVLRQNNWNRVETARQLGIHKATLYRKMKSLGLKVPLHSKQFHF